MQINCWKTAGTPRLVSRGCQGLGLAIGVSAGLQRITPLYYHSLLRFIAAIPDGEMCCTCPLARTLQRHLRLVSVQHIVHCQGRDITFAASPLIVYVGLSVSSALSAQSATSLRLKSVRCIGVDTLSPAVKEKSDSLDR
eukprot:scaffold37019_cov19-Prasinocladus_malaysianus.AAC.2